MGRQTYRGLKKEIHGLNNKLDIKTTKIAALLIAKHTLENKVFALAEKLAAKKIPMIKETDHKEFCDEHREVVGASTNFTEDDFVFRSSNPATIAKDIAFALGFTLSLESQKQFNEWEQYCNDKQLHVDGRKIFVMLSSIGKADIFIDGGGIGVHIKKDVVDASTNFSINGLIKIAIDGLEKDKKQCEDELASFSSRFMPNVKFKAKGHLKELNSIGIYCSENTILITRHDGKISLLCETGREKEVSIYEAIPELVPEGKFFNKKSGALHNVTNAGYSFTGKYAGGFPIFGAEGEGFIGLSIKEKSGVTEGHPFVPQECQYKPNDNKAVHPNVFSSRFMPNVKFRVPVDKFIYNQLHAISPTLTEYNEFGTDKFGHIVLGGSSTEYYKTYNIHGIDLPEVSIYEAIPELVPDGMFYDKKSDSLIEKEIVDTSTNFSTDELIKLAIDGLEKGKKQCEESLEVFLSKLSHRAEKDPISDLAKEISKTRPYNCSQIQWALDTFEEKNVLKILDMCTTFSFDVMDLKPKKS